MELLKIFDLSDITNILSGQYMDVLSKYLLPAAIPMLIIALVNCFLGHKVFKVLIGMAGLLVGGILGGGIVIGFFTLTSNKMPSVFAIVIACTIGAVLLGISSYKLYKGGAFCMGFITGMILGIAIMKWMNQDEYLIAGVIGGLLMGLLAIDLYRHVVILLTSTNGGFVSAACLAILLKKEDPLFILKVGIALSLVGIIVQYILLYASRKNAEDNEEEEVNIKEEKRNQKNKETKIEKKENKKLSGNKKKKEKRNKQKSKKKKQEKRKYDYEAEFFLVEIISSVAQKIKDFVVDKFGLEEDEEEDLYDDELENANDNDDLNWSGIEEIELEDLEKEDTFTLNNSRYKQIEEDDSMIEEINKHQLEIANEEEETIFDLEDLSHKLEEELEHSLEADKEKELEDLIIKEAYKNLD